MKTFFLCKKDGGKLEKTTFAKLKPGNKACSKKLSDDSLQRRMQILDEKRNSEKNINDQVIYVGSKRKGTNHIFFVDETEKKLKTPKKR